MTQKTDDMTPEEKAKLRGDVVEVDETEEEETEEVEETTAEETTTTEEETTTDDKEEVVIPKWRFDEAQRKARERLAAAEAKLEELERKQAKQPSTEDEFAALSTEVDKMQDDYEAAILEGDVDKARGIRKSIKIKQDKLMDMRLQQQGRTTGMAAIEQMRYDAQLAQLEAKYPALNPDSTDFNAELETEVGEVMAAFKAKGLTPAAALLKAVHYVLRPDAETTRDADIVRSQRSQQARKKAAAAAKAAPPDLSGRGRDSDKGVKGSDGLPDPTKMTLEQFDKLSPADRAKLRGDALEDVG